MCSNNPLSDLATAQAKLVDVHEWILAHDIPTLSLKKTWPTEAKLLKLKIRQKHSYLDILNAALDHVIHSNICDSAGCLQPDTILEQLSPGCKHIFNIPNAIRSK